MDSMIHYQIWGEQGKVDIVSDQGCPLGNRVEVFSYSCLLNPNAQEVQQEGEGRSGRPAIAAGPGGSVMQLPAASPWASFPLNPLCPPVWGCCLASLARRETRHGLRLREGGFWGDVRCNAAVTAAAWFTALPGKSGVYFHPPWLWVWARVLNDQTCRESRGDHSNWTRDNKIWVPNF